MAGRAQRGRVGVLARTASGDRVFAGRGLAHGCRASAGFEPSQTPRSNRYGASLFWCRGYLPSVSEMACTAL